MNRLQEETSDAHLKLLCSIWVLRSGVFGVLCNHTWYVYYDVYNGPHFGSLSWAHVSNFYYFYFFPHKGWLEGSQWPNVCVNQATQETRWLFWKHAMYKWIGHILTVIWLILQILCLSPNKYVSPHSYSSHSLLVVVFSTFNGAPLIVYFKFFI